MLTRKRKIDSRENKIVAELAKWGITKDSIGPLLLGILVGIILSKLGIAHELDSRMSEEDVYVGDIRDELRSKRALTRIGNAVIKEQLDKALYAIVQAKWARGYF